MKKLVFLIFAVGCSLFQANASTPQRLISLSPHITELVFAAGAGERLVAVDKYSDWPEAAKRLPKIGDAFTLNVEYLSTLKPDLVLIWGSGTNADKVSQLQRLGISIVAFEPDGIFSIADDIEKLGDLLGTSLVATEAASRYRKEVERLSIKYENRSKVSTFYQIDEYSLFTVGGGHIIDDAISLCGGRNIFNHLRAIAPPVSKEAVIAEQPELIVSVQGSSESQQRLKKTWLPLSFIPAVARGNIRFVDADLVSRPGPRFSQGIAELCEAIDSARRSDS